MSSLSFSNVNYSGIRAGIYLAPALISGKMVEKKLMQVFPGVKNKMSVPVMKLKNGTIKPYTQKFMPSGGFDLSDRELDPQKMSVHLEFPYSVLEQLYESERMMAGIHNTEMPESFQEFVIQYVTTAISAEIDNIIWNSDKAGTGEANLKQIDGLLKGIKSDTDVHIVDIEALTTSNILTEFNKVFLSTPANMSASELTYYVSPVAMKLYVTKLATMGNLTPNQVISGGTLYSGNIIIEDIQDFPDNEIICTPWSNIVYGTDLESDIQKFIILDMRVQSADDELRVRCDFKVDVEYGFGENITRGRVATP